MRTRSIHAGGAAALLAALAALTGACAEQAQPPSDVAPRDDGGAEDGVAADGDADAGGEDGIAGEDGDAAEGEACSPECRLGDRECVNPLASDSPWRECVEGPSGCSVWGEPQDCATGTFCEDGTCTDTCSHACAEGEARCASETDRAPCTDGPHGCRVWGEATPCGSGLVCTGDGECVTCANTCESGTTRCGTATTIRTCETATDGCLDWSVARPCPSGDVCWNDVCVESCIDLCASAERRCLGDQYQTCMTYPPPTPCRGWSAAFDCPSGRACVGAGICPTCTDTCTEGVSECATPTTYRTCVRSTITGCTEMAAAEPCGEHQECQGAGECVTICTDACPAVGDRSCAGTGEPQACVVGTLGCRTWEVEDPCPAVAGGTNVCDGGACVLTCGGELLRCGPLSCRASCAPWTQQHPTPAYEDIRALAAVGTTVWAVGNSGAVARSADSGVTWTHAGLVPGRTPLWGVDFADASHGWAVGDGGAIFATEDGGDNWTAQASGVTTRLRAVSFASATHGWAVGESGVILATTDGGDTWSAQTCAGCGNLHAVSFVSSTTGWAAGAGGRIMKTANGGTVWLQQTTGSTYDIHSIRFLDADTGWAVGYYYVYRTSDGGANWTRTMRTSYNYYGVWPLSATAATIVGQSGRIEATTDGTSWSIRTGVPSVQYNAIVFTDANHAVAAGQNGTVIASSNAGIAWMESRTTPVDSLRAVRFADASHGWAVGNAGRVLQTADAGATWTSPTSVPTAQALWAVAFADATHGWAVGASGTVIATTDGGTGWTAQTSNTTATLYGVHFPDTLNGWAVGTYAASTTVVYTPDGGTTWQPMIVSGVPTTTMYGVWFNPCSGATCRGWIVGTSGTIRYTSNYGVTWTTPAASGTSQTLYAVRFVDDNVGFAVGNAGTVVRTTNGGVNWAVVGTPASTALYDLSFTDADHGFASGAAGTFLRTTDGGTTWLSFPIPTSRDLRGISFTDASRGWVAGDYGTILTTRSAGE